MNKPIKLVFFISVFMLASANAQGQGKLIATSGVGSVEGTAGGGIIPWAPWAVTPQAMNGECRPHQVGQK